MKRMLGAIIMMALMLFTLVQTSVTALAEDWTCPACGSETSGNFCSNCGTAKPSAEWVCPDCGTTTTGNFCSNCGTARPTGEAKTVRKSSGTVIAKKGDKSDTVKIIQEALVHLGYFKGKVDGQYGKKLKAAVKKYQHDNYLEETGIVDSVTFDELKAVYDSLNGGSSQASDQKSGAGRSTSSAEEISLREGKYVIGKQIAAGTYKLTCTGTAGSDMKDAYGALGGALDALDGDQGYGSVFNAYGSMFEALGGMTVQILGDFGDVLNTWTLKVGDSMNITLEEGTALSISDGNCQMSLLE